MHSSPRLQRKAADTSMLVVSKCLHILKKKKKKKKIRARSSNQAENVALHLHISQVNFRWSQTTFTIQRKAFEGENFRELVKIQFSQRKTFAGCSLLPHQRTPRPKFRGENFRVQPQNREICESFLPQKFSAIWYFHTLILSLAGKAGSNWTRDWECDYSRILKFTPFQTGLTPKNGSDFLIRILFFGPRVCLEQCGSILFLLIQVLAESLQHLVLFG